MPTQTQIYGYCTLFVSSTPDNKPPAYLLQYDPIPVDLIPDKSIPVNDEPSPPDDQISSYLSIYPSLHHVLISI